MIDIVIDKRNEIESINWIEERMKIEMEMEMEGVGVKAESKTSSSTCIS